MASEVLYAGGRLGRPEGTDGGADGRGAGVLLAVAVSVLALPIAVLAFTTRFDTHAFADIEPRDTDPLGMDALEGDSPGLRLARGMRLQSLNPGQAFAFTPAKNPNRPDRSVTVAVRLDPQALRAISARGNAEGGASSLALAQSAFSLGVARGYRNFAPTVVPPAPAHRVDTPEPSRFTLAPSTSQGDSRFTARGGMIDERQQAGRTGRGFADGEQMDVGGSYRVTRNIDVTAGVRYTQDRERLRPQTDGRQDSQAVYVGTQLRF